MTRCVQASFFRYSQASFLLYNCRPANPPRDLRGKTQATMKPSAPSSRGGTSAPSPSAPSFRGGGPSALSSSLSKIPPAKLLSSGGRSLPSISSGSSVTSRNSHRTNMKTDVRRPPAAVVVARPVAPAEMPRVRNHRDGTSAPSRSPLMAQIVEEDERPVLVQRSPSAPTLSTPQQAQHHRSQRPDGSSRDQASRPLERSSTRNARPGTQPSPHAHNGNSAPAVRSVEAPASSRMAQGVLRRSLSDGNSSVVSSPPSTRFTATASASWAATMPSASGQARWDGIPVPQRQPGSTHIISSSALMGSSTSRIEAQGCCDDTRQCLKDFRRTWYFRCAIVVAMIFGAGVVVLSSIQCDFCWSWWGQIDDGGQ